MSQDASARQPLDVSPQIPVAEACRTFGRFVTFELKEPAGKAQTRNAFTMMMKSASAQAQSLVLPIRRTKTRRDWRLSNKLIADFEKYGLGFSASSRLAETKWKGIC